MILSTRLMIVTDSNIWVHTSTCQPSFLVYSQSSREVRTLLESTAVHVGMIAPSPSSKAKVILMRLVTYNVCDYSPISLCVKMRPPNLPSIETYLIRIELGFENHSHLAPSARMSFLRRCSIASRFSGRSDKGRVFLGSAESRRTKGRPEI